METLRAIMVADAKAMFELGRQLGTCIASGEVLGISGPLGAGKTVLVQGLAKGLGIEDGISSPSFAIIHEHQGRLTLYHIDAYRLAGEEEAQELGLEEMLEDPEACTVVEWPENLGSNFCPRMRTIAIDILEDGARKVKLNWPSCEELLDCPGNG